MKRLGRWFGLATVGMCALGCPGPHEAPADSGTPDAGHKDAGASTGSLALTVTGLGAVPANVKVTGPGGYTHDSMGSELLASLMLGTYTVNATLVRAPDVLVDTIYDVPAAAGTAVVAKGTAATVTVAYSRRVGSGLFFVPSPMTGVISAYDKATLLDGGINLTHPAKVTLTALLPDGGTWFGPEILALDPAGNLWAGFADEGAKVEGLARFPAASLGATTSLQPDIVLSPADAGTGRLTISFPQSMAFDPQGNLWTANCGKTHGILRLDKAVLTASGAPFGTLWAGAVVECPGGLAFDKSGNLWVANCGSNGGIYQFSTAQLTSATTPVPAISIANGTSPYTCPENIAFNAQGDLLVTECGTFKGIAKYPAWQLADGGSTGTSSDPAVTLTHPNLKCPTGLALDNASNLWAVDYQSKTVTGIPVAQLQDGGVVDPISSIFIPALDYGGPVFDATPANLPLLH